MLRVGDGAAAVCALLVPKLHQSGVWKLQPLLGCAGRNAEDSVCAGTQVHERNALLPSFLPSLRGPRQEGQERSEGCLQRGHAVWGPLKQAPAFLSH